MGRTLPTVNQVLEQNREQWSRFYRALRKEDRELLDRLFDGAKYFTAACVYQANVTPSESIVLAMLLHLEKELQALKSRLGVENVLLSGVDAGRVSDAGSDGGMADRVRRKPPLLLR
jgi:hypothetical protein